MRVLHVTPYFAPAFRYGGPPRSILGLCRALESTGVDVEVFTTTANGDRPLTAAPGGVDYEGVRVRYFPLAWPERYWRAEGLGVAVTAAARAADVIHVHGLWNMTSWSGVAAARRARRPHVISPRGMLQPDAMRRHRALKTLAYWGIERRHLTSAALLHATSAAEQSELTRYGVPVATIPNGVAPICASRNAVDALRARTALRDGDEVVVFLGRLHPIKRLDLLADAFAAVHRTNRAAKLLVAGPDEGGYRARVEPLFARIADVTHWLGPLEADQIGALLSVASVLVQCSDSESFGMSIAEALAAGVPVVTTRQSGWAELETIGAGYCVDHDADSIARGITKTLADPNRAVMRTRAREWATRNLSWDAVARAMVHAYENVSRERPQHE